MRLYRGLEPWRQLGLVEISDNNLIVVLVKSAFVGFSGHNQARDHSGVADRNSVFGGERREFLPGNSGACECLKVVIVQDK
jgi:hypothetical protein